MFQRKASTAIAAVLMAAAPLAGAQDQPVPAGYFGVMAGYVIPDKSRDADYGINAFALGGYVLDDAVALELSGFAQRTRRTSDKQYDSSYGGGLDLALGTSAPGNPFFLLGGGAISQNSKGLKTTAGFGDLGLGVYLPFSIGGELWRVEGRYNAVFDQKTVPGQHLLEDVRINVGVLFGLGHREAPVTPAPETAAPEPAAPAAPVAIGPDEDGDGVPDAQDKCPGTPKWVRADANGCSPDSDGDGISDDRDCCPDTPPGTPIDGQGCPLTPPAPAVAKVVEPDEDGDGVPDRLDKCPHTPPGVKVGDEGCVILESIALTKVHYDTNMDMLSPEGFQLLNSVASTMKVHPTMVVEVAGHADVTGGVEYNKRLSLRRANLVRDFLIYQGIPADRLKAVGYGKGKPVASNKTKEGRAENRRVEFRVVTE